ncbi:MAG: hypothetical protein A2001_00505 [Treponema sp. GWC1_61_84]|nr:MAG: hypothetical protein A2001_00505 [Treponema sp. GWC1_61_84]
MRIQSLSSLQLLLEKAHRDLEIDLATYLEQVLSTIAKTKEEGNRIDLVWSLAEANADSRDALVIGLIVNELVENAYRQAFPGNRPGTITVDMKTTGGGVSIAVSDSGTGSRSEKDGRLSKNAGFGIVSALAARIGARLSCVSDDGFNVRIDVPRDRSA